jgi:ankyrin repeat protein
LIPLPTNVAMPNRRRSVLLGSAAAMLAAVAMLGPVAAVAQTAAEFFKAVELDDERTLRRLLERGFDPNTVNDAGQPGLVLAMRDDCPKVAAVLLAHPAIEPDKANAHNETALMMAALRGRTEWVERLLARGAKLAREGWTPLHYAASGSEPALLKLLLARGAPIDAPSPNRTTPLMMAAGYGAIDGVDVLLAAGANRTLRNDAGLDVVDFARRAGRDRLVERLQATAAPR